MAGIVLGYGYKILLIGTCAGISLHSFVLEMQGTICSKSNRTRGCGYPRVSYLRWVQIQVKNFTRRCGCEFEILAIHGQIFSPLATYPTLDFLQQVIHMGTQIQNR
jgi:hypothetical protein